MAARREADQSDAPGTTDSSQVVNLSAQSDQWLGVAHQYGVAKHAGSQTEAIQPADDRLALMRDVLGIAPAG